MAGLYLALLSWQPRHKTLISSTNLLHGAAKVMFCIVHSNECKKSNYTLSLETYHHCVDVLAALKSCQWFEALVPSRLFPTVTVVLKY